MSLHITLGPMFSGKTSKLISLYHESTEPKVILSPKFDTRHAKGFIKNHDGSSVVASTLKNYSSIRNLKYKKHIFVDEIQFISSGVLNYLARMSKNKEIFFFGLNLDWTGATFPNVESIWKKADFVSILRGKCCKCGEASEFSAKKIQEGDILEVGAEDLYFPLCRKCFYLHRKGRLK